jgi:hypothetical protein
VEIVDAHTDHRDTRALHVLEGGDQASAFHVLAQAPLGAQILHSSRPYIFEH